MPLEEILMNRIRATGPISFHDYMETALYHPGEGYYTSCRQKIGKDGDYYTSPYLTSLFGQMIAVQLAEIFSLLGKKEMTIVEYGAGQGLLAHDILGELMKQPSLHNRVRYVIIEKSEVMKQQQQQLLTGKVQWYDDLAALGNFDGCVIANEVLDNFAVHQVMMQDELMEVFVDYENGFKELFLPAGQHLKKYLADLKISLPAGHRAEINLEAITWIQEVATRLQSGAVLTIDYGYGAQELYSPHRKQGTLLCYQHHSINDAFYSNPGQQDITAHVNFSALKLYGEKYGLQFGGFTNQAQFLLSLGLSHHLATQNDADNGNGQLRVLQSLLMDMGRKMKVLALQKGFTQALRGMRFPLPLV